MFAYDYASRTNIRVRQGAVVKPILHREMMRLGVNIFDRVMATALLTQDGRPGSRVIGAAGVNVRTGEFHLFTAKAVHQSTGRAHISTPEPLAQEAE